MDIEAAGPFRLTRAGMAPPAVRGRNRDVWVMKVWVMKAGLALCIAALAAAGPALAGDKGTAAPPPPRSADVKDVEAWVKRYIADDNWYYSASSDDGAVLISPSTMQLTKRGTVRFWYRSELFKPEFSDGKVIRSYNMLQEIDCADRKVRYLAGDAYLQNSLGGPVVSKGDYADAEWEYPRPGTVNEIVGQVVCSYVDTVAEGLKQQAAENTGVNSHF